MSEIAATSSLICIGLLGACMVMAWVWSGVEEFRKRRPAKRERRKQWKWMRILQ